MKVQSAKPQISTQVPQSFDDTQLDNDFTEGFSELIAALNMGIEDSAESGGEILQDISAIQEDKKDKQIDSETDNELQDTIDSILFGMNIPVPQEIKQIDSSTEENVKEVQDSFGNKQGVVQIDSNLNQMTSRDDKKAIDLDALATSKNQVDKISDNPTSNFNDKIKLAEKGEVASRNAIVDETQAVNLAKHMDVSINPAVRQVVQLDPNATLQDKPSMVLQELGRFINQHTTAAAETKSILPATQPTISYTQTLDKLSQIEPGMVITKSVTGAGAALKDVYTANIKIHPPELGEVTATLKIEKNTAQLILLTENDHVKSIVQSHLVQLKENFQKSDLHLTNVDVQTTNGEADKQQQRQQSEFKQSPDINQMVKAEDKQIEVPKTIAQRINSLIDTYV